MLDKSITAGETQPITGRISHLNSRSRVFLYLQFNKAPHRTAGPFCIYNPTEPRPNPGCQHASRRFGRNRRQRSRQRRALLRPPSRPCYPAPAGASALRFVAAFATVALLQPLTS